MSNVPSLQEEISQLNRWDLQYLRGAWEREFRKPPVARLSRDLLILSLAWQLQAKQYGGLSKSGIRERAAQISVLRSTGSISESQSVVYKVGTKLVREWQGQVHEVIILSDGYLWLGNRYRSLSKIARSITGTRWSGPRFFGLEKAEEKR